MATECFFVFSILFTGSSIEIEIGTASTLIESRIKVTTFQIAAYLKQWLKMYLQGKMMARLIAPLHQFKAGVAAEDVACGDDL